MDTAVSPPASLLPLLQAISPSAPCGQDLSFSAEFDRIAEMRRADDPSLDQGEWVTSLKVADWPGVVRQCTDLLQHQTKDLRVANWLTEAWALCDGFEGLALGLALQAALCDQHWDHVHPLPDGGDQEERIGNLTWMLQRVVTLPDTLPVTRNRQGVQHSLRDLERARNLLNAPPPAYGQPDPAAAPDAITLEQLQKFARETPAGVWQSRLMALDQAEVALSQWQAAVDARLGADGPGFVKAREKLASVRHSIERMAKDAGVLAPAATDAPDAASSGGMAPADASPGVGNGAAAANAPAGGPPVTRAQALQRLREVAEFFRRTEPHSPVAYLADKAVKWGDMPLHEWLRHVIKDQGSMAHLQELLGLDPAEHQG